MNNYRSAESLSVESLIGLQKKLSTSRNPFDRLVGSLFVAGLLKEKMSSLPDQEVGQLMFDYVWNEINVFSPELKICEAAIERLLSSSSAQVKSAKENINR